MQHDRTFLLSVGGARVCKEGVVGCIIGSSVLERSDDEKGLEYRTVHGTFVRKAVRRTVNVNANSPLTRHMWHLEPRHSPICCHRQPNSASVIPVCFVTELVALYPLQRTASNITFFLPSLPQYSPPYRLAEGATWLLHFQSDCEAKENSRLDAPCRLPHATARLATRQPIEKPVPISSGRILSGQIVLLNILSVSQRPGLCIAISCRHHVRLRLRERRLPSA